MTYHFEDGYHETPFRKDEAKNIGEERGRGGRTGEEWEEWGREEWEGAGREWKGRSQKDGNHHRRRRHQKGRPTVWRRGKTGTLTREAKDGGVDHWNYSGAGGMTYSKAGGNAIGVAGLGRRRACGMKPGPGTDWNLKSPPMVLKRLRAWSSADRQECSRRGAE
ncbi:hypothetical protein B0H12DRAFT_1288756 [Mycena haematopus]|nr:hypothetical protein B0H12DRAFT_1288756 [Mycena haematopus]